ncbi:hypothetical protein FQA39_LY08821 [Lamprigera yunnana]|nr:hypothetical protein FQA39_LY08821 [Lamprigera yunnana]
MLLTVFSALATANAFYELVPSGKELIYKYNGEVSVGTNIPRSYASQLLVYGNLHLQLDGRSIVAQLSNVTYKLYNGHLYYGYKEDLHTLDLPDEASDLLKPFKISYNSDGELESLSTEKNIRMYARNMHRAIASLLQMNIRKVNFDQNVTHAFTTFEQNLYGKSNAEYSVTTKDDFIVVRKMHQMKTSDAIFTHTMTNLDFDYCEAPVEESVFHDSQQEYYVKKNKKQYYVDHIKSHGSFHLEPFHANSEDHFVSTKISLDLVNSIPITTIRSCSSEQTEYNVYYRVYDKIKDDSGIDLTNGRHSVECDKDILKIEEILVQIGHHLHDPINEKDSSIQHAITKLISCKLNDLQKLYSNLKQKSAARKIFHQVLPYVGSHASVIFIKTIIFEKETSDIEAVEMLTALPGFVRNPTEKLLKQVEDMLDWGSDCDEQVRRSAILSFASLIYKTYEVESRITAPKEHDQPMDGYAHITNNINGHQRYNKFFGRIKNVYERNEYCNKYLYKFAKMIDGRDISEQILGAQALFNTKSPKVFELLEPIAKGDKSAPIALRVWSIWMVAHVIVGNPNLIYELCWPIMINTEEPMELRIVAYYVLMESHPSLTRLLNIQHTLEEEKDSELYYVHYKYILRMSSTSDSCHYISKLNLAHILKNAPQPRLHGLSDYYQIDYTNSKYQYGEDVNYISGETDDSFWFKFEYNLQFSNKRFNPYTIYVRIEGLDKLTLKTLRLSLKNAELFDYNYFMDIFKAISNNDNIVIFLDRSTNKRITHSVVLKGKDLLNSSTIWNILRMIGFTYGDDGIEIKFEEVSTIPFPTEIGIPVILESILPVFKRHYVNAHKEVKKGSFVAHVDNNYYYSARHRYGLTFYNPLADIWQALGKFHSMEIQLPLFADINVDTQKGNLKLSLKKHGKEYKDDILLTSSTHRQIMIKGDQEELLKKSCPKCERGVKTEGRVNKHNSTIELDQIGYVGKLQRQSGETEIPDVLEQWSEIYSNNYENNYKNNYKNFWENLIVSYHKWVSAVFHSPTPTTTQFNLILSPTAKCENTQVDINGQFKETVVQEKNEFLPSLKYNFRVSAAHKNKDEILNSCDVHLTTDLNRGHTFLHTKLELSTTKPETKEFKVSYEESTEWHLNDISGNATLTIENFEDDAQEEYDITYVGTQLSEQKDLKYNYKVCEQRTNTIDFSSAECLAAHTSLRRYVFNIKSKTEIEKFKRMLDIFINSFNKHYKTKSVTHPQLTENNIEVIVTFPTSAKKMDVACKTKYRVDTFEGVPVASQYFFGPLNTHKSSLYSILHNRNLMQMCYADAHKIKPDHLEKTISHDELGNDWTKLIGDAEGDCTYGLFIKRIKDTSYMAIKAVHGSNSLEIRPRGHHYEDFEILVDGKVKDTDVYSCDWFSYLYQKHKHAVILNTLDFHLNIKFEGKFVTVEIPRVEGFKFYGKCFT